MTFKFTKSTNNICKHGWALLTNWVLPVSVRFSHSPPWRSECLHKDHYTNLCNSSVQLMPILLIITSQHMLTISQEMLQSHFAKWAKEPSLHFLAGYRKVPSLPADPRRITPPDTGGLTLQNMGNITSPVPGRKSTSQTYYLQGVSYEVPWFTCWPSFPPLYLMVLRALVFACWRWLSGGHACSYAAHSHYQTSSDQHLCNNKLFLRQDYGYKSSILN